MSNHKNKHHFFPTSRFLVKKDTRIHNAFHELFQNRTGWEAIELLKEWGGKLGVIPLEFLNSRSKEFRLAFSLIFGEERVVKALADAIKRDWIPPGVHVRFDWEEIRRARKGRKDLKGMFPQEREDEDK